jgi:CBS domain-containing protein
MQLGTRDHSSKQGGDEGVVVTKGGTAAATMGGGWNSGRTLAEWSRVPRGLFASEPSKGSEPPAMSFDGRSPSALYAITSEPARGSVADIMGDPPPVVPAHLTVAAARKIARLKSADMLLVEDGGRMVGVVDGYTLEGAAPDAPVTEGMKPSFPYLRPDSDVRRARDLLVKHGVPALLVAVGRFVVGAISRAAVERALGEDRRAAHAQPWAA